MPVPITLEEIFRVVFLFETRKLRELGIARQHLVASRVPVVGGRRGSGRINPGNYFLDRAESEGLPMIDIMAVY